MKVSELTGDKLDYWVAKAQGWEIVDINDIEMWQEPDGEWYWAVEDYHPTRFWEQTGRLAETIIISVVHKATFSNGSHYEAYCKNGISSTGASFQYAICRAIVASVYGDSIEDASGGEQ